MTKLDDALAAAKAGKGSEMDFYNLFLNSELLVPLAEPPNPADPGSLKPILIESDGKNYLMLFDSEDRLAAWAKRKLDFAGLKGADIVAMMDPSVPWVLNVGTEHVKVFVPDEIQWLKSAIERPSGG